MVSHLQVHSDDGPGLNLPLTCDPSGLFIRRQGHSGDYLVGLLPRCLPILLSSPWDFLTQSLPDMERRYQAVFGVMQTLITGNRCCSWLIFIVKHLCAGGATTSSGQIRWLQASHIESQPACWLRYQLLWWVSNRWEASHPRTHLDGLWLPRPWCSDGASGCAGPDGDGLWPRLRDNWPEQICFWQDSHRGSTRRKLPHKTQGNWSHDGKYGLTISNLRVCQRYWYQ